MAPDPAPHIADSIMLGYLMNQYPYASCTFIRREILSIEAAGMPVVRFSVRPPEMKSLDPQDVEEEIRTRCILGRGFFRSLLPALIVALGHPLRMLRAAQVALRLGWRSSRGFATHLAYFVEALVLLRWCRQSRITHLHAHFGTNAATVAMLCRLLGGPSYSFTVHGPEEFDRPAQLALGRKMEHAAFVVAISSFTRSQLLRWCDHQHWSKIHVIHCGVDSGFLAAPPTAPPIDKQLVCIGRLSEQKGQLLLIDAAAKLAAEGHAFQIVLVGDGPMRSEIERAVTRHHLQQNIRLVGWQDEEGVRRELLASRAMVLPSFAEGLPVVIMEALALGRPVISTYIAGIPELVQPGRCGWLVPAGSVDALVDAMRQALHATPQQLEQMGRAGAHLVAEHHNIRTEAARLAELFMKSAECSSASSTSSS